MGRAMVMFAGKCRPTLSVCFKRARAASLRNEERRAVVPTVRHVGRRAAGQDLGADLVTNPVTI
jgi:hypothetical protein